MFPFAALVGLDTLKLALQLAAIDFRLSVLIRGDKGAGKSTAARGLADLLSHGAPFVTLPIGATDDRLLGGLDLERAMNGEPALKPGLLAQAHDGVLYVDEVNLLPDHLADALLDAVASGVHVVEREGFSASHAAEFVLVGSMNPEEGALRPQLLDRFALAVDVEAPLDPDVRGEVLDRRLAYDADPPRFAEQWADARTRAAGIIAEARARVAGIVPTREMLRHIAQRVAQHGVRSLRADLAIVRASRACAALEGASEVTAEHVERVLDLTLAHRPRVTPRSSPPPSPPPSPPASTSPPPPQPRNAPATPPDTDDADNADDANANDGAYGGVERVFAPMSVSAPRLLVDRDERGGSDGSSSRAPGRTSGPVVASRRTTDPRELDARATVMHAVVETGSPRPRPVDLHERVRAPQSGTRYIFIVDSSGSHAIQERMGLVKGVVSGLLASTHARHDEVVVIACRGAAACVLVEPTASRADAERALEYLPTGGRTPLAHALELASAYVTDRAITVLITDGHANVPRLAGTGADAEDAWADALTAAGAIGSPALVIDSEDPRRATGRPRALADAMRATCVRMADLDHAAAIRVLRDACDNRDS